MPLANGGIYMELIANVTKYDRDLLKKQSVKFANYDQHWCVAKHYEPCTASVDVRHRSQMKDIIQQ